MLEETRSNIQSVIIDVMILLAGIIILLVCSLLSLYAGQYLQNIVWRAGERSDVLLTAVDYGGRVVFLAICFFAARRLNQNPTPAP